jgi:two-component system sensor histidine kinase KdpD
MKESVPTRQHSLLKRLILALCFSSAIFVITRIALQFGVVANPTTVGFSFLILVVFCAIFTDLPVAIVTSVVATLCYNYFFFPPVGTFRIAAFDNWIAVFAFLLTAIVISRLTASAHENSRESESLKSTLAELKEFGIWILSVPREQITLTGIVEGAVRIFSLQYCSLHVYMEGKWHHYSGTARKDLSEQVEASLAYAEDHPTGVMELVDEQALGVRYAQILREAKPVALLVVRSESLPQTAVITMASLIGVLLTEALQAEHI